MCVCVCIYVCKLTLFNKNRLQQTHSNLKSISINGFTVFVICFTNIIILINETILSDKFLNLLSKKIDEMQDDKIKPKTASRTFYFGDIQYRFVFLTIYTKILNRVFVFKSTTKAIISRINVKQQYMLRKKN